MQFELDYSKLIPLDAEALAEGGIAEAYKEFLPALVTYVKEADEIHEVWDNGYSVRHRDREYVIYKPESELGDEQAARNWGNATYALFAIVNAQLTASPYRFYAINGGNDLAGMFMTTEQCEAAKRSLERKNDWPYLPAAEHPAYGQILEGSKALDRGEQEPAAPRSPIEAAISVKRDILKQLQYKPPTRPVSQFRGTSIYQRDDWIYVWVYRWGIYYHCLAKHPSGVDAATLGRDVLAALRSSVRMIGEEERRSRPDPRLIVMGCKTYPALFRGLAFVSVGQASPEQDLRITPWRSQGPGAKAIVKDDLVLPKEAAAAKVGACVLRQLVRSSELTG